MDVMNVVSVANVMTVINVMHFTNVMRVMGVIDTIRGARCHSPDPSHGDLVRRVSCCSDRRTTGA